MALVQEGGANAVPAKLAELSSERRKTVSRLALGNSMPMALRPGMTATRAAVAFMVRAMSSERPITREDFMPAAGSNSNKVTTGPGRAESTYPCTPKSASTVSN